MWKLRRQRSGDSDNAFKDISCLEMTNLYDKTVNQLIMTSNHVYRTGIKSPFWGILQLLLAG